MMYDNDASRRYRKEAEAKVREVMQRTVATDQEHTEHELRIYQVELEMQNLELREIQQRLQQSLDHISCLYHQSPVGFVTIDNKGRVLDLNESFATMLGIRHRMPSGAFWRSSVPMIVPAFCANASRPCLINLKTRS
jgi:PAS domain-containing protein